MTRLWIPVFLLATAANAMAEQRSLFTVHIQTTSKDGLQTVVPYLEARSAATLRYRLVSTKSGKAGHSVTSQEGTVEAACCAPQPLATLKLSVAPSDHYVISVTLFDGSNIVAEETIRFPD
jgi:Rieske Fe-S protein